MVAGNLDGGFALAGLEDMRVSAKLIRLGPLTVNGCRIPPTHQVASLAAHGLDINLFVRVAVDELKPSENIGVEGAGKSFSADE